MSEICTLLFLELRSFYGINKFLHTKDSKFKSRYMRLSVIWVLLIVMICSYVGGLVFGLCSLGLAEIVPAYLTVISSAVIVMFGIFTAGNRIFNQKGYYILSSMPIKASSVVISRFFGHYLADLLLTLVIMVSGTVAYGIVQKPHFSFYIMAFASALFIPAIPLVISTAIGTFITAVSSRMKNKSVIQSILMVLFVLVVMLGSFTMESSIENLTVKELTMLAQNIGATLEKVYYPSVLINSAVIDLNIINLLLFVFVSVAVSIITLTVISVNFHAVMRRLLNFTAKHNYKIGKMESRGLLKALCLREAKRYFSSSIYVTNTIIGPIMSVIMSVALCIVGVDTLKIAIPFNIDICDIAPFVISAVFCMMTTTSTAISMEGKQFWIIKSLPIPTKVLLDSKILFNLILMLPFYVVSQIALIIAVRPSALQLVWQILISAAIILFSVIFGITVNLKFRSFDWEREETVVKQSVSAAIGGFAGFFLSVLLGAFVLFIPKQFGDIAKAVILGMVLIMAIFIYKRNNKKKLIDL